MIINLHYLNYLKDPKLDNYGIFLIMSNAGFVSSAVYVILLVSIFYGV